MAMQFPGTRRRCRTAGGAEGERGRAEDGAGTRPDARDPPKQQQQEAAASLA